MTFQPAAALPVDADLWWIVYLRGALVGRTEPYATGVYFDRRVPKDRRDRMVIVRRDGGGINGLFDQPRMSVDVWAKTDKDATDLANLILALAQRAPLAGSSVTNVTNVIGPNSVPEESGQARRLASFEATHRAVLLTT